MSKEMKELRSLGTKEVQLKIVELKASYAKECSLMTSGTRSENPGKIKKTRRTIARIFTTLKEREMKKEIPKREEKAETNKVETKKTEAKKVEVKKVEIKKTEEKKSENGGKLSQ